MNPLFMSAGGSVDVAGAAGSSTVDAIMAQRDAPPTEVWRVFQASYADLHRQLEAANAQLVEAKKAVQLAAVGGGAAGDDDGPSGAPAPGARKKAFAPRGTAGGDGSAGASPASALAAFRRNAKGPALRTMRANADAGAAGDV